MVRLDGGERAWRDDRLAIGMPTSKTRAPAAGHALVGVVTTVVLRLAVEAVTAERLAG